MKMRDCFTAQPFAKCNNIFVKNFDGIVKVYLAEFFFLVYS
jgi:hypothetical protein